MRIATSSLSINNAPPASKRVGGAAHRVRALLGMLFFVAVLPAHAASTPSVLLPDSISGVAMSVQAAGNDSTKPTVTRSVLSSAETNATMEIEIALKMRNFSDLQSRISNGETISSDDLAQNYEPAAADYQNVVAWLTSEGLTVSGPDPHHLAIFATGTVNQMTKAFQVTFARVATADGEFTSAITAPNVPSTVASVLVGINGLQPHLRKSHHTTTPILTNSTTGNGPPFLPAQIAKAYNATGITQTGSGQTIAIVIDAVPSTTDLTTFWSTCGIKQTTANITYVPVGGTTLPATDTQGEATLDVEWSSSMAPAAKVRVYATMGLTDVMLDQAYLQIFNDLPSQPGLHQVSLSYGGSEVLTPTSQLQTDAQYFAELANAGVTVLVSTGDGGSRPNGNTYSATAALTVLTPASDPSVTAVGGTSLTVNASTGAESTETGWSGSGGGSSSFFARPSWQTGAGVASGTMRLIPDVAATADPNTGALVILNGMSLQMGGTSWSAPTWAGYCALINQARASNTQASLGFLGPKIYPLIGTTSFRDITSGSNGDYSAGKGYDMVTGVGAPNITALIQALGGGSVTKTTPPSIVTQPASVTVTAGQTATFSVTANGTATLAYQWSKNSVTIAGATTATLTIANAQTTNAGNYTVVVTDSAGSVTSAIAVLTVNPPAVAPTITAQPQSVAVTVGQNANFSVTATGTGTLAYQWMKNGLAIKGATTAAMTIANAQTTNAGNYTVVVSNSVGSVTSAIAILTVNTPVIAPTITKQPQSLTVTAGQTATFSVTANGTATLAYQWSLNGAAISGATSASYVIASAQAANAGNYTVKVSNSAGSATSSAAVLTVNPAPTVVKPAITQQPSSLTVTVGQSATFSVLASGTGPLSYQWKKNGTAISGATSATYAIASTTTASAGSYTVTATNSAGSATSSVATLTVNAAASKKTAVALPTTTVSTTTVSTTTVVTATPPAITTPPQSQTVAIGGSIVLSVSATGTGPLSYQWTKNGAAIDGATAATLTLSNVQVSDSGYYAVAVYNNVGLLWSDPATVTVDVSLLPLGLVNASSVYFPAAGVPAGLTPLQGQNAAAALAWLNQLTLLLSYENVQASVLNQALPGLGTNLSGLVAALSTQNLDDKIAFDLFVGPWLLEYNSSPKLFYVAANGDIYVQAVAIADDGSSQVASTLCLPAND